MSHSNNSDSFGLFLSSIKGMGHPKYPILDSVYSPNSRVPCTDLIPFIADRIIEKDKNSIKLLMRAVTEGSLFPLNNWIDEYVNKILSGSYADYVSFSSARGLYELQALLVLFGKNGGSKEFLISQDNILRLILWACIVHHPLWSKNLNLLVDKANSWISKMAKDLPHWEKRRFNIQEIPGEYIRTAELREKLMGLTPAARLQLFYVIERCGGPLLNLTNYQIRSFGIDVKKTSKELIESGLVLPFISSKSIRSAYSKKELLDICKSYGVLCSNSWNKEKIIESIHVADSSSLEKISKNKMLVEPNFQTFPELRNVIRIADTHNIAFKLLCFV